MRSAQGLILLVGDLPTTYTIAFDLYMMVVAVRSYLAPEM